jgi:protein gp37
MGRETGIEWTDSTWNPIRGCSRISEGCRNCYAESVAARFSAAGQAYEGLAKFVVIGEGTKEERVEPRWTGRLRFVETHLRDPLKWKSPARIFVNSMSDLFHPNVTADMLGQIFEVMAKAPQHTYQILTKRPDRMREALIAASEPAVSSAFESTFRQKWPPANWWFGVSVEDQETATHRLKFLEGLEFFNLFVSYEPALGPVDWFETDFADLVDWIICGGESGVHARPMSPAWARATREFCEFHSIPFFFKQWGEWRPGESSEFGKYRADVSTGQFMVRTGKHNNRAVLDGVEWKEFPCLTPR